MIIYEVNLSVDKNIFAEYYEWLLNHVQTMLSFNGFLAAEISEEKTEDNSKSNVSVRYQILSEKNLNDYFKNHATAMREDGLNKFGNKFAATRRVFFNTLILKS